MTVVLTVREVPEDVRDLLAREASGRGQSMQAYLLSLLQRQAGFARNRQVVLEIQAELFSHGGVRSSSPGAAEALAAVRAERGDRSPPEAPRWDAG